VIRHPSTPLSYPTPAELVDRLAQGVAGLEREAPSGYEFRAAETAEARTSVAPAGHALRARELSPVELVAETIRLADAWEPSLRSLVLRFDEQAMEAARAAEEELAAGVDRGPLHGIPVVVKDHIDVAGAVTAAGSRLLENNVAWADAEVVARLRAAGAVIFGKANTHELAFGAATPPTRNPWDLGRIPGGSSGGSAAAVGAGIVPLALGTDSGASIREPSAFCGTVGLKPTFGRVSCRGVLPFAWSLDTVGPMGASAEDCEALLAAIEDRDVVRRAPTRSSDEGERASVARIGIVDELVAPLQADVADLWARLLDHLSDVGTEICHVSIGDVDQLIAALLIVVGSEAYAYQREWVAQRHELYSPDVLAQVEMGASYSAADYVDAGRVRREFSIRVAHLLEDVDVLATPSQFLVAPRVADELAVFPGGLSLPLLPTLLRPLAPFAFSGHPAVSVPLGLGSRSNLPVGAQLVGAAHSDHRLLADAAWVQAICDWRCSPPSPPKRRMRGKE
jgi:aspartyl-tRNA(Asn)/glutamyl-tRNA(Gln) amidotransferase subunit A